YCDLCDSGGLAALTGCLALGWRHDVHCHYLPARLAARFYGGASALFADDTAALFASGYYRRDYYVADGATECNCAYDFVGPALYHGLRARPGGQSAPGGWSPANQRHSRLALAPATD